MILRLWSERLASTSRSPLLSHFTESITGLMTIRAFRAQKRFEQENRVRVDRSLAPNYLLGMAFRWSTMNVTLLNAIATFLTALIITLQRGTINPSIAAAAMNFALSTSSILGFAITLLTQLEVRCRATVLLFDCADVDVCSVNIAIVVLFSQVTKRSL